ncbi:polysaccharide lyase family 8 [Purpureocillium lilacinum]|uniref:Polysaccharide lyase family 8 n=1 Tax=Purpureocillium lilacinum TaxID=33203 RepID=A0A179GSW9_PURLI|nr:polysaccharide lyase family 8 [Purpureocillium lilacinum]OAQ80852.1 polysaccharide lyase family 8 [Purpureocillium lilacinum]
MRASVFSCMRLIGAGFLFSGVARAASLDDEVALVAQRQLANVAQFPDPPLIANIDKWLAAQKSDGTWSDVNYLSGCAAQRANWPIQEHWNRVITFAAAWSGANPSIDAKWKGSEDLMSAISKGLDYWFDNDYKPADCMGNGGNAGCPCGTPGLWNTNWYGQAILIPQLCSTACLLLKDANLTESQNAGCARIPRRSYDLRDGSYGTGGKLTAANVVLVMQNSVNLALYTNNATMLADAYSRTMKTMTFADTPKQDGTHRDGTFLQHVGILYNGNYGKDFFNVFIALQSAAIGTSFAAPDDTRSAIAAQARGNEWMIFTDYETRREHWDFNAIGRFVAFPVVDKQASADINFNTSKLAAATKDFTGANDLSDTIRRLQSNGTEKLVGNKGFWASDYMVHRRNSFILTNKMLSVRSTNSESVNGANPYAFHLGQGTLFSYVTGNEYKDIMAAWDWNLVPGTTTQLNTPKLAGSNAGNSGKKDFVGVVSDGKVGTSVEDYVDPLDASFSYRKAWFYSDDSVLVVTSDIKSSGKAPVITVLDNRAAAESNKVWVNDKVVDASHGLQTKGKTLFYGGNGYVAYGDDFALTLAQGDRTGNWTEISTSTVGVTTVPIFSGYTTITKSSFSYAVFPATSRSKLAKEARKPTLTPILGTGVSGAAGSNKLSLVFWPGGDKSITVDLAKIGWDKSGSITITSDQPGAYLFKPLCNAKHKKAMKLRVTLSDPTQKLTSTSFSIAVKRGTVTPSKVDVELPTGGMAGSSTSRDVVVRF